MPHIKTVARLSNDGHELAWFCLTSANVSSYAWGDLQKGDTQLFCGSWELGVLFTPKSLSWRNVHNVFSCAEAVEAVPFSMGAAKQCPEEVEILSRLVSTHALPGSEEGSAALQMVMPIPYELPPVPYQRGEVPWHADGHWRDQPDAFGFHDCHEGESTIGAKYHRASYGK